METLQIIGACASIGSLLLSIFILTQINSIKNRTTITGDSNQVAGKNIKGN